MGYHEQRMTLHKRCAAAFAAAAVVLGIGSYKAFENVDANKQRVETTVDVVAGQPITRMSREHTFESGSLVVGGIVGAAGSLTTALFSLASLGRYRRRARGEKTYEEHRADAEALRLQQQQQPEPGGQA
jgi:hypothetical protein